MKTQTTKSNKLLNIVSIIDISFVGCTGYKGKYIHVSEEASSKVTKSSDTHPTGTNLFCNKKKKKRQNNKIKYIKTIKKLFWTQK